MSPNDLLWKVLRATTNSPNDVWKPRHYERHNGVPKKLLGKQVIRYTVPIKFIAETKYGNIYLVIQFCTDDLNIPYFAISKNAFTNNLGVRKEYVYTINVRLCLENEFKLKHKKLNNNGLVKHKYREDILINALGLIRNKPRWKIISKFIYDNAYAKANEKVLENIILNSQFDDEEKLYKGIAKNIRKN